MKTILFTIMIAISLCGCANDHAVTKIKYVQYMTGTKLRLADNSVVSAPPGFYYMLYIVNCIDNSTRDDGFVFNTTKIKNFQNEYTTIDTSVIPSIFKIVGAGETETGLGQVVVVLPGPARKVLVNLNYASYETESVLMVNQTPTYIQKPNDDIYASIIAVGEIKVASATSAPAVKESNLCTDKGTNY